MRKEIAHDYPHLATVGFSHFWSGDMAYVQHRMPVIGQIAPNIWVMNAFGGDGLNTTAMAGQIVADAITGGSTAWTAFAPFNSGWGLGGKIGRGVVRANYWRFRAHDALFG